VLRTPDWLDDSTPGVLQESISSHPSRLRGTEGPLLHQVWWAIVCSFPTILPVPTITCAEEFDHMQSIIRLQVRRGSWNLSRVLSGCRVWARNGWRWSFKDASDPRSLHSANHFSVLLQCPRGEGSIPGATRRLEHYLTFRRWDCLV
jgi:hypothetical protein